MSKITSKDLERFSITLVEAKEHNLESEDLIGIIELIPKKKYRIMISNGKKEDGSRNRVSETVEGDFFQALEVKKRMIDQIKEEKENPSANMLFKKFAKLYCKYLEEKVINKRLDLTTYESYYQLLESRIIPYFGKMRLKDIDEFVIEKWLGVLANTKTIKGTNLHPTTITHLFKLLSNMFNFGVIKRIIKENPCDFVSNKPTEKSKEKEYFTLEEMDYIKILLKSSNIRFKTAMYLLIDSGCRREEIIGLKWCDIDFIENKININKAVVSTPTRTSINNQRIREKGVKSSRSERRIGVPSVCIELLIQYRNFKKDCGLKVGNDNFIFTNWMDNNIWDPNRYTTEWCTFRKEHDIKKNVSLHGLRHSIATYLLSQGIPKKDVAKRMGHSPDVLDRIYTHSDEKDDEIMVKKIDKGFYNKVKQDGKIFSTASIISVVAGYINNEYRNENYYLLDYLSKTSIDNNNLEEYLNPCIDYLISKYPILDLFKDKKIITDEKEFKIKLNNFIEFMGKEITLEEPKVEIKKVITI